MDDWLHHALLAIEQGQAGALISVLAVEGSTPREAGTRMWVSRDRSVGTIGGGNLEFQAIKQARAALDQPPGSWRLQDYPLGPFLQQCCGGRVRLLVEHLDAAQRDWLLAISRPGRHLLETLLRQDRVQRRIVAISELIPLGARGTMPQAGDGFLDSAGVALTPLLLFGAGHVGQAIVRILDGLPFALSWYDNRAASVDIEGVMLAEAAELTALARDNAGLTLILTHDHALDYQLATAALAGPARFVGMIGSASKRARFLSRLAKDGFDDEALQRLICPIGLPGLSGKAPAVIAIAVAAQLLQLVGKPKVVEGK